MKKPSVPCAAAALVALATLALPKDADAFCGFYVGGADAKLFNNATQVALMREGTRTVLSMQNNYEGPAENFALVVPVPVILQKENVKTLPKEIFDKLDKLAAPRLVEYWERDPCEVDRMRHEERARGMPRPAPPAAAGPRRSADLGVTVEAQFTVGEYEIVILSAKDAGGLDMWLRREKYSIPPGAEPYFRPYVQQGSKFFVAKVDATKVKFERGMANLSPLRFHYDSDKFALPVRLGLMNANGPQDLIVHVLAKNTRYEVANYPNVTIPTNLDVAENAKSSFGSFYTALFDRTLEKNPRAVVTEYSWDASTCDPCPLPALTYNELATLGADALAPADSDGPIAPVPPPPTRPGALPGKPSPGATPSPRRPGGPMRGPRFMPSGFVITRLHARYTKESLGEDLVFRAAPAIMGGREFMGTNGKLEERSRPSDYANNFQARYAVRHPWTGPIACANPVRGRWGGPPAGIEGDTRPKPAQGLAFAPRNMQLASFLRSDAPELGVAAAGALVSGVGPSGSSAPGPTPVPAVDAGSPAVDAGGPSADANAPKKQGCGGCDVGSAVGSGGTLAWPFVAFVAWRGRRRARRKV
ncbi:MAG: DUF2330 domain-containing protein [Myxococcales bacterium]|nr:DUF2330 domain-containing protein [Myxococcales bacterium]HQY64737.1 DUF2330 domain-containing protein [Polyangiaceae bacterium]